MARARPSRGSPPGAASPPPPPPPLGGDETRTAHPSFGLIQLSRSCGGHERLFGSPVAHHHKMRLVVRRAEECRTDLHYTTYYGRETLLEVELSSAQFGEMVTSVGLGDGVPCTLRRVGGEDVPACPDTHVRKQFEDEFAARVRKLDAGLGVMLSRLDATAPPAKADWADLVAQLGRMVTEVRSNLPFVARMFGETAEQMVHAVKAEVVAAQVAAVERFGAEGLAAMAVQNQLALAAPAPPPVPPEVPS